MSRFIVVIVLCCLSTLALAKENKDAQYQHYINNAKKLVWSGNVKANKNEFITIPPKGFGKDIAYIPDSGAKRVLRYGMLSGAAQACDIEWEKHYRQLMAYQRNIMKRNPYQMAYVGVLHGAGMSITEDRPCGTIADKNIIADNLQYNIKHFTKK